jgi:hypothetical protein
VVSDYWVDHRKYFLLIDLWILLRKVFRSDWFLSLWGDRRLVCGLVLIDLSIWFCAIWERSLRQNVYRPASGKEKPDPIEELKKRDLRSLQGARSRRASAPERGIARASSIRLRAWRCRAPPPPGVSLVGRPIWQHAVRSPSPGNIQRRCASLRLARPRSPGSWLAHARLARHVPVADREAKCARAARESAWRSRPGSSILAGWPR